METPHIPEQRPSRQESIDLLGKVILTDDFQKLYEQQTMRLEGLRHGSSREIVGIVREHSSIAHEINSCFGGNILGGSRVNAIGEIYEEISPEIATSTGVGALENVFFHGVGVVKLVGGSTLPRDIKTPPSSVDTIVLRFGIPNPKREGHEDRVYMPLDPAHLGAFVLTQFPAGPYAPRRHLPVNESQ